MNMYSPKIKEELVRELYKYKKRYPVPKPMTFFVNEALKEYLGKENKNVKTGKGIIRACRTHPKRNVYAVSDVYSKKERR